MEKEQSQQQVRDLEAENEALRQSAAEKDKQIAALQKADISDEKIAQVQNFMKQTFGSNFQFTVAKTTDKNDTEEANPESGDESEEDAFEASVSRGQQERNAPRDDADPLCNSIPAACVNTLNTWFRTIMNGAEIKETLKSCERPENCDCLKTVIINPEIKAKMLPPDDIKDKRMRWLCEATPKAAWPLASAWAELLRLEFHLQQQQPPADTVQDAVFPMPLGDQDVNVSDLIRKIELSLKVIGISSVQGMQKRRYDLQYKLSGPAKELAEFNHKFDHRMFGPQIKTDVANIIAVNKMAKKITSTKSSKRYNPFLGRQNSRGRGRGSYQNQYNSNFAPRYENPPMFNQNYGYDSPSKQSDGHNRKKQGPKRGRGGNSSSRK